MQKYRLTVRRTTLIALGCASFLAGLGLVQAGWHYAGAQWWVVAGCLALCCLYKRRRVAVPAVIMLGLLVGLVRGTDMAGGLAVYQAFISQKVTVSGTVVEDAVYNDKGQKDFRLTNIQLSGLTLPGQVRITSFAFADIRRGDQLQASGKLYSGFGNYQAAIYYAEVEVLTVNTGWVEQFRRAFAASVYTNVPEPQASLGLGFLVGIKSQLPDDLNDQLQIVGLTHIVVASGYNLTILVRLARRLFERRSKYQTALVSASLLLSFVAVTGFSPSMSRAALVAGLSLAAWYYGRVIHPVVLLLFAAALTAGINPLYVWGDLGWWLSFLAFAGVMLLAPLVQRRLFGEREPKLIGQVMLETICAQVTTLPLIVAIFGVMSVISLPANVLIVPLVPLAMLLTFVAGLSLPVIGPYLAMPATWLLSYMTELVQLMAAVDWASLPYQVSMGGMLACYALLTVVGVVIWRRTRYDYLGRNMVE